MAGNSTKRSSAKPLVRSFRRMSREAKVNLAIDMSSTVATIGFASPPVVEVDDHHGFYPRSAPRYNPLKAAGARTKAVPVGT